MIDLQHSTATQPISLNKVGIKCLKHPVEVMERNGTTQAVVATFDMYVDLAADKRGTHMSRFVEILNQKNWVLSAPGAQELLQLMQQTLSATQAYLDCRFDFFLNKAAPVSKQTGLLDYQAGFSGQLKKQTCIITQHVTVPVTTLCPCSKAISAYGAHNQRSHIQLAIQSEGKLIEFESLIALVEKESSCEIYSVLKRPDEKYVTEQAYDNPKFVEDIVRNIAHALENKLGITNYRITSENFESIHNHSAYACIERNFTNH